jgi:hypothetical protein
MGSCFTTPQKTKTKTEEEEERTYRVLRQALKESGLFYSKDAATDRELKEFCAIK